MKNKLKKIFAVLAILVLAPIGVILTGCGSTEPSLKLKSSNRSVFYFGEDFDDVKWKVLYYDGNKTRTIDVTTDMVVGFNIDNTKELVEAKIFYNGLSVIQKYSVRVSPFDLEALYRSEYPENNEYSYIQFSSDGGGIHITKSSNANLTSITNDLFNSSDTKSYTFTERVFDKYDCWTCSFVQHGGTGSLMYEVKKMDESTLKISTTRVEMGITKDTQYYYALAVQ